MEHQVRKLPDAPILINSVLSGDDTREIMAAAVAEFARLLDQQDEPVFVIVDLSLVHLDLAGHIDAARTVSFGPDAVMHHPKVREHIFITSDPITKQALMGMSTATFGMARLSIHDTLDAALDYCYDALGRPRPAPLSG